MRTVLFAFAVLALIGNSNATRAEDQPNLDKDFLVQCHVRCNAILQYANVAKTRASTASVKEFAEQLIKDHTKVEESIATKMADRKTISVAGAEKELRENIDRIKKLEGAEFDREFLKLIVDQHQDCVTLCKNQADQGKDAACKTLAKEMVPSIQKHLDRAKELQKQVK